MCISGNDCSLCCSETWRGDIAMTKPMYCPMSFNNVNHTLAGDIGLRVCTPDCAWAVTYDDRHGTREYFCAVAKNSFYGDTFRANTRPLKDDNE